MNNNATTGTKLLMTVLTLALLAYFGIQAFRYFTDPLSVTMAYTYRVEEATQLSGFVVRDEQLLSGEESGLLRLDRTEGARVGKGGAIATVYADQVSLDRQEEIATLTARLEQLRYAQEAALGAEVSLKLDNQIMQSMLQYRGSVAAGKFYEAEQEGAELRALVLKRDYTYSDQEDLSAQIDAVAGQIKELKNQSAGSVRRVYAPRSGLYSTVVDGYETVLTPAAVMEMTPTQLSAVTADGEATSNVGKLILGDSWYYAAILPAEQAQKLQKQNGHLTLRFAKGVERDLAVEIESVSWEEDGSCVVVFRGDAFLQELTLLRKQSAQIITRAYEGIRVPSEALRIRKETIENEDGTTTETTVTGIYCVVGQEARFKPVEVLYSGEGFVLLRGTAAADRQSLWLRPGDEVIISARDLYDGKVISG